MAKNSRISQRQAQKVRRQKITAAVFGAIFLVLAVFQGPRTLKMLHGSSSPSTTPAASATSTTAAATTSTAGAAAAPAPVAAAAVTTSPKLGDSDRAPERTKSQLVSFDTFDSKDPFVQQVSEEDQTTAATATAATATAATATATTPDTAPTTSAAVSTPAGGSSTTYSSTPSRTIAASTSHATRTLTSAVVAVNGERQPVGVEQTFPKVNPTFKLVALSGDVARIGIAGGNYASGAQTVALRLGHTLTLVNTADGTRYELRLVSTK